MILCTLRDDSKQSCSLFREITIPNLHHAKLNYCNNRTMIITFTQEITKFLSKCSPQSAIEVNNPAIMKTVLKRAFTSVFFSYEMVQACI